MNGAMMIAAFIVGMAAGIFFDAEVMQPLIHRPVPPAPKAADYGCPPNAVCGTPTTEHLTGSIWAPVPEWLLKNVEASRCFDLNGPENTGPHAWNDAMFAGRKVCK